jgi:hypothetical protein
MRFRPLLLALAFCATLTGCPLNTTQQQALANASDNAAKIAGAAQQVEITAYQQQLITQADHDFIETQFKSLATAGLAADTCIKSASAKTAALTCLSTYATAVQTIGAQDVGIKSSNAQATFNLTITSIEGVLSALETELGS